MTFFHFPSHFVYWTQIPEHVELKKVLMPIIQNFENDIKNNKPFSACNVKSSFECENDNVNSFLRGKKIEGTLVWKPLFQMLNEINKKDGMCPIQADNFSVSTAWYNIYSKNDFQELHDHDSCSIRDMNHIVHPCFSLIYILHDQSNTNSTVFQKKESPCFPRKTVINFDTSQENTISEGTVIIFPSDLPHLVKPCLKDGRVTISYNVMANYE
tara:strand:- start:49 stop:687 length:639 start_codon:yes stop_codon:yes gene_type:complete